MKITIDIIQQENEFIAVCPELDINCYGKDKADAIRRIQNVILFYIESAKELGFDVNKLEEILVENKSYCFDKIHYKKESGYLLN